MCIFYILYRNIRKMMPIKFLKCRGILKEDIIRGRAEIRIIFLSIANISKYRQHKKI